MCFHLGDLLVFSTFIFPFSDLYFHFAAKIRYTTPAPDTNFGLLLAHEMSAELAHEMSAF